ncbi:hypothetical protein N7532_002469 [Penicillium argentinense]|uniref:Uncharacterized protein n=1 Tax=Penicillium argentinense TaxID=1131581 RepID=A0A9W9G0F1_9EURO|nr:uncharacterized protein N7532_002469 [Penicillium argentinense]KAJ5109824.1 hypothetical protein N7532_002469 [Penicillium argentinense]
MHISIYFGALLLAPLSVFASPNIAFDTNTNILRRDTITIMTPVERGVSPAHVLARSPRPDSDDDDYDCASDQIKCGDACFPDSYSCCPNDFSGGCPSDKECRKRNGRYGCCDDDDEDRCRFDDDDGDSIFDKVDDFGDDVKDKWDDFWDNSGPTLKPELGVLGCLAGVAAIISLFLM